MGLSIDQPLILVTGSFNTEENLDMAEKYIIDPRIEIKQIILTKLPYRKFYDRCLYSTNTQYDLQTQVQTVENRKIVLTKLSFNGNAVGVLPLEHKLMWFHA